VWFPTPLLADPLVEARLRDLGFGYRARFLRQSAAQILDSREPRWLEGLRGVPYPLARDALRTLPGVGTKVEGAGPLAFIFISLGGEVVNIPMYWGGGACAGGRLRVPDVPG